MSDETVETMPTPEGARRRLLGSRGLAPVVIELSDGPWTIFADSRDVTEELIQVEPKWVATVNEPEEIAAIRRHFEAGQRLLTEDLFPDARVQHFAGGSVVIADGEPSTTLCVLLYGLLIRPGIWTALSPTRRVQRTIRE